MENYLEIKGSQLWIHETNGFNLKGIYYPGGGGGEESSLTAYILYNFIYTVFLKWKIIEMENRLVLPGRR